MSWATYIMLTAKIARIVCGDMRVGPFSTMFWTAICCVVSAWTTVTFSGSGSHSWSTCFVVTSFILLERSKRDGKFFTSTRRMFATSCHSQGQEAISGKNTAHPSYARRDSQLYTARFGLSDSSPQSNRCCLGDICTSIDYRLVAVET